jgi:hypothetical protein
MDNMAKGASRTYVNRVTGKVGDRVIADERPDTGEVSKVVVPDFYHTQDLPAHVVQLATALTFVGQSVSRIFTPYLHQRLSHLFIQMGKELLVVYGTNVAFGVIFVEGYQYKLSGSNY